MGAVAEDYYLNKCLLRLGVPSVPASTFPLLYDKYEYGDWAKNSCGPVTLEWNDYNPKKYAVYHDYKDVVGWMRCYNETNVGPCIDPTSVHKALSVARAVAPNRSAHSSDLQFKEESLPHGAIWDDHDHNHVVASVFL